MTTTRCSVLKHAHGICHDPACTRDYGTPACIIFGVQSSQGVKPSRSGVEDIDSHAPVCVLHAPPTLPYMSPSSLLLPQMQKRIIKQVHY